MQTSSSTPRAKIPVRNLWLLLLYASDLVHTLPHDKRITVEKNPDKLTDVIAEILTSHVETRLRRSLSMDFERRHADLTRVRGRIEHLRTMRMHLLQRGRIACSFDAFTVDTLQNRLVKTALDKLTPTVTKPKLAQRCRANAAALEKAGVCAKQETYHGRADAYNTIATSRIIPEDRMMLAAAILALELDMPTEDAGYVDWITAERNEKNMGKLFEKAVLNFYKIRLEEKWSVKREILEWNHIPRTKQIGRMLPRMETDITLENLHVLPDGSRSRIIIDTKFTKITEPNQYSNEKFQSRHMYQMYAYLRSQEKDGDRTSCESTGILLYPSSGVDFDESTIIQGHVMRFVTVDLSVNDPYLILDRLQRIVSDHHKAM